MSWMYAPLYRAMDSYHRITGDEDAHDWVIAIGQAFAHVLYQEKHGNFQYQRLLADFPVKGFAWDHTSWIMPEGARWAEGVKMSGYMARHWPDACARAYSLCGERLLKQRAYDYWFAGSHRGYHAQKMHNLGGVGMWVNYYRPNHDVVGFSGRAFYEHAHPRKDTEPPAPITDLHVMVDADKATVRFTAPADGGGGKAARYQVKCSDKPIVSYQDFLQAWAANEDGKVTNWWMAANLKAEPTPKAPGEKESFVVSGVPEGAGHFAVRSFDDSSNRSSMSNVARVR
jgi:hypothetical protein